MKKKTKKYRGSMKPNVKWGKNHKKQTGGSPLSIGDAVNFRTPDDDRGKVLAYSDPKKYILLPVKDGINSSIQTVLHNLGKGRVHSKFLKSGGRKTKKRKRRKRRKTKKKRRYSRKKRKRKK